MSKQVTCCETSYKRNFLGRYFDLARPEKVDTLKGQDYYYYLLKQQRNGDFYNHRGFISDFRQIKQRVVQRTGYVRRWFEGKTICSKTVMYAVS